MRQQRWQIRYRYHPDYMDTWAAQREAAQAGDEGTPAPAILHARLGRLLTEIEGTMDTAGAGPAWKDVSEKHNTLSRASNGQLGAHTQSHRCPVVSRCCRGPGCSVPSLLPPARRRTETSLNKGALPARLLVTIARPWA